MLNFCFHNALLKFTNHLFYCEGFQHALVRIILSLLNESIISCHALVYEKKTLTLCYEGEHFVTGVHRAFRYVSEMNIHLPHIC